MLVGSSRHLFGLEIGGGGGEGGGGVRVLFAIHYSCGPAWSSEREIQSHEPIRNFGSTCQEEISIERDVTRAR